MSLISFDSFAIEGKKAQFGGSSDEFGEEDTGTLSSSKANNTNSNSSGQAGNDAGNYGDDVDDEEDESNEKNKDSDDNLSFGSLAVKELLSVIQWAKDRITRLAMVVVMFFAYGGIYPTIPIFGVLAVMFSLLKYVMFKFRKF